MKRIGVYFSFIVLLLSCRIFANEIVSDTCIIHLGSSGKIYHPVHFSYTNIDYNQEKGKFEFLFKIFVDDFDHILMTKYGKDLKLKDGQWENSYIDVIRKYILEHFKIKSGTKEITAKSLKFIRKEINEGAIWLYFDLKRKEKSNIFEVHNSLMTDLYVDQSNLLIFTYMDIQKSFKFDSFVVKEIFSFEM